MTTRAAEVIFIERDPVMRWDGREGEWLMLGRWDVVLQSTEGVQGSIHGRPVMNRRAHLLTVHEEPAYSGGTEYQWKTLGTTHPGGNRNESARDWSEVQAAILRWASRRFRVEVES